MLRSLHKYAQIRSYHATTSLRTTFVVHALDYTDEDAFKRRMSVREEHLMHAKEAKKSGLLKQGGAMLVGEALDEKGTRKMIGSFMIFEAPTKQDVEKWLHEDVYVNKKIWETYEIREVKWANID